MLFSTVAVDSGVTCGRLDAVAVVLVLAVDVGGATAVTAGEDVVVVAMAGLVEATGSIIAVAVAVDGADVTVEDIVGDSATTGVDDAVIFANASAKPGQVGLLNTLVAQGSTPYISLA